LLRSEFEVSGFFVVWICVISLSILFAADDFVFTRSLFMLPWVVLSGLGLSWVILFILGLGVLRVGVRGQMAQYWVLFFLVF
jgi:hypothetical protein